MNTETDDSRKSGKRQVVLLDPGDDEETIGSNVVEESLVDSLQDVSLEGDDSSSDDESILMAAATEYMNDDSMSTFRHTTTQLIATALGIFWDYDKSGVLGPSKTRKYEGGEMERTKLLERLRDVWQRWLNLNAELSVMEEILDEIDDQRAKAHGKGGGARRHRFKEQKRKPLPKLKPVQIVIDREFRSKRKHEADHSPSEGHSSGSKRGESGASAGESKSDRKKKGSEFFMTEVEPEPVSRHGVETQHEGEAEKSSGANDPMERIRMIRKPPSVNAAKLLGKLPSVNVDDLWSFEIDRVQRMPTIGVPDHAEAAMRTGGVREQHCRKKRLKSLKLALFKELVKETDIDLPSNQMQLEESMLPRLEHVRGFSLVRPDSNNVMMSLKNIHRSLGDCNGVLQEVRSGVNGLDMIIALQEAYVDRRKRLPESMANRLDEDTIRNVLSRGSKAKMIKTEETNLLSRFLTRHAPWLDASYGLRSTISRSLRRPSQFVAPATAGSSMNASHMKKFARPDTADGTDATDGAVSIDYGGRPGAVSAPLVPTQSRTSPSEYVLAPSAVQTPHSPQPRSRVLHSRGGDPNADVSQEFSHFLSDLEEQKLKRRDRDVESSTGTLSKRDSTGSLSSQGSSRLPPLKKQGSGSSIDSDSSKGTLEEKERAGRKLLHQAIMNVFSQSFIDLSKIDGTRLKEKQEERAESSLQRSESEMSLSRGIGRDTPSILTSPSGRSVTRSPPPMRFSERRSSLQPPPFNMGAPQFSDKSIVDTQGHRSHQGGKGHYRPTSVDSPPSPVQPLEFGRSPQRRPKSSHDAPAVTFTVQPDDPMVSPSSFGMDRRGNVGTPLGVLPPIGCRRKSLDASIQPGGRSVTTKPYASATGIAPLTITELANSLTEHLHDLREVADVGDVDSKKRPRTMDRSYAIRKHRAVTMSVYLQKCREETDAIFASSHVDHDNIVLKYSVSDPNKEKYAKRSKEAEDRRNQYLRTAAQGGMNAKKRQQKSIVEADHGVEEYRVDYHKKTFPVALPEEEILTTLSSLIISNLKSTSDYVNHMCEEVFLIPETADMVRNVFWFMHTRYFLSDELCPDKEGICRDLMIIISELFMHIFSPTHSEREGVMEIFAHFIAQSVLECFWLVWPRSRYWFTPLFHFAVYRHVVFLLTGNVVPVAAMTRVRIDLFDDPLDPAHIQERLEKLMQPVFFNNVCSYVFGPFPKFMFEGSSPFSVVITMMNQKEVESVHTKEDKHYLRSNNRSLVYRRLKYSNDRIGELDSELGRQVNVEFKKSKAKSKLHLRQTLPIVDFLRERRYGTSYNPVYREQEDHTVARDMIQRSPRTVMYAGRSKVMKTQERKMWHSQTITEENMYAKSKAAYVRTTHESDREYAREVSKLDDRRRQWKNRIILNIKHEKSEIQQERKDYLRDLDERYRPRSLGERILEEIKVQRGRLADEPDSCVTKGDKAFIRNLRTAAKEKSQAGPSNANAVGSDDEEEGRKRSSTIAGRQRRGRGRRQGADEGSSKPPLPSVPVKKRVTEDATTVEPPSVKEAEAVGPLEHHTSSTVSLDRWVRRRAAMKKPEAAPQQHPQQHAPPVAGLSRSASAEPILAASSASLRSVGSQYIYGPLPAMGPQDSQDEEDSAEVVVAQRARAAMQRRTSATEVLLKRMINPEVRKHKKFLKRLVGDDYIEGLSEKYESLDDTKQRKGKLSLLQHLQFKRNVLEAKAREALQAQGKL